MALIPPFFMDCVVAIGADDPNETRSWIASGFLFGYRVGEEDGEGRYLVYLIINRHVFLGLDKVFLRFNPQAEGPPRDYELHLLDEEGGPLWLTSGDERVDVAAIPVNMSVLQEHAMQAAFFADDRHSVDARRMRELGITEGDFAYVLGFPMGMIGRERRTAIVRGGILARIRDALAGDDLEFLLDVSIFPGNSGGPVVTKPETIAIQGTEPVRSSFLIGIVRGYVAYQQEAISRQVGGPRVVFQENSGLAAAHLIDSFLGIVATHAEDAYRTRGLEESEPPPAEG